MRIIRRNNINHLMLNESQESDSQKLAIKLLIDKLHWEKERANAFVRTELRKLFTSLGHDTKLGKFTYGLTRIVFEEGLGKDDEKISEINQLLPFLKDFYTEYDKNLNGLSSDEIIKAFSETYNDIVAKEKNILSKMHFGGKSDYKIVHIKSFDDAQKFMKYTPKDSIWCITASDDSFEKYARGGCNIYFCLQNGFERVPEVKGENAPFDRYGLSMICVVVNRRGELKNCVTRWNHINGSSDFSMDAVQLSRVLGLNFYDIFSVNDTYSDELKQLQQQLNSGTNIKDIFDNVNYINGCYICIWCDYEKYVLVDDKKQIITKRIYDAIEPIIGDDFVIRFGDRYNIINNKGKHLLSKNIDYIDTISVQEDCLYNIMIKTDNGNKFNFFNVNTNKCISDVWFDKTSFFENGICKVKYKDNDYVIDANGNMKSISMKESFTNYSGNILYVSIDLDNESRLKLKSLCEPIVQDAFGDDAIYKCHHMTISHYTKLDNETLLWCEDNIGKQFTLYVDSIGVSDKAVAVAVDVDGVVSKQAYPHITVAINPLTNGKPVDSNYITDFEDVYQNIELHGKLTFHYKGESDNTTLLESEIRKPIQQHINESWVDNDDNPDIIDYLNDYKGTDFRPDDIDSYTLRQWVLSVGDFLYAYDFPFGGLKLSAANTSSIVEDIANDIENCGYIEHTHEIDDLLLRREDEFRNMYVAVYKICDVPGSKDYYVVYQEER